MLFGCGAGRDCLRWSAWAGHARPVPQQFEKEITVKVLPNGLTLIICERPEAPVFSYHTLVDAGDVNDPSGESGLAHMFEHLAFKGTSQIGTTDYAAEKVALEKVEAANDAYEAEYLKPVGRDEQKLKELKKAFLAAQAEAEKYVIPNQFTEVAEANGAHDLNAETGLDDTQYFWSMPENRLELWAWLESSRLADTVPREFYKERDVVIEERRMRTDSNPIGRLVEQFLATAYVAHNYGRSEIGWPSEVSQITATEAMAFHKKYYVGGNVVVAIVGDVDAKTAMPMLEKYFSRVPGGPKPEDMTTVEPQAVCREVGGDPRADAADLYRGLSPAELPRPRRRGVRRHQRHHVERARFAALPQFGGAAADCCRGRGIQPVPRREISEPVRVLRHPAARPHSGGDARGDSQGD